MSGQLVLGLRVLLAVSLYLFLCLTLWLIWLDLKQAGFRALRTKIPPLHLEVRPSGADPFFRAYTQAEFTAGRDPGCELRIEDEAVSARHAKLSFHHAQWWIEDLHSTNGTNLNQSRLMTATVLTDGDEIRCGKTSVIVRLRADASVPKATSEERHD
jgi:hypothetical protein